MQPRSEIKLRPPFSNLQGVLFDFDGTLIDSADGIVEAINFALGELGESLAPPIEITRSIGYPLDLLFARYTQAPYDRCYQLFRMRADVSVPKAAEPLEGAETILQVLSAAGFRLAIVTTKSRLHLDRSLEKLGWHHYFAITVSKDDVLKLKPDPEPFQRAVRLLGIRPDEAIVVGDTENDIRSAHDAGLFAVGVRSPYDGHDRLVASSPDWLLESIADLPQLLFDSYHAAP